MAHRGRPAGSATGCSSVARYASPGGRRHSRGPGAPGPPRRPHDDDLHARPESRRSRCPESCGSAGEADGRACASSRPSGGRRPQHNRRSLGWRRTMTQKSLPDSLPDFAGKVALVYHVGSRDPHSSSALVNAHFERQGGRLFLCGEPAPGDTPNDWAFGCRLCVAWVPWRHISSLIRRKITELVVIVGVRQQGSSSLQPINSPHMDRQRSQLLRARRARRFLRFSSRFEDSPVSGYVLDVGPRFFLLALVSDRIWFDGFECFRVRDVRDVRTDPYARFAEAALKRRRERVPRKARESVHRWGPSALSWPRVSARHDSSGASRSRRVLDRPRRRNRSRSRLAVGDQARRHVGQEAERLPLERDYARGLRRRLRRSLGACQWRPAAGYPAAGADRRMKHPGRE
jgi:hypothetical protein